MRVAIIATLLALRGLSSAQSPPADSIQPPQDPAPLDVRPPRISSDVESADPAQPSLKPSRPAGAVRNGSTDPGCHGYSLLTPLYGLSNRAPNRRNPNQRNGLRVTGPVASGIGGGYYRSFDGQCDRSRALTYELFGFSEGLDTSNVFQLGIGAGISITAFGNFQFGLAIGYDLIRHEMIDTGGVSRSYNNGLLLGIDVLGCGHGGPGEHWGDATKCMGRNLTWLLTFSVTSSGSTASKPSANAASATL
jgi:hypothetical protein